MSPTCKFNLSGAAKAGAVILVVSLGLWGCARKPADNSSSERVRALEAKCVKSEQDYRTAAQALVNARRELTTISEKNGQLEREAADRQALIKERDDLRKAAADRDRLNRQLAQRTAERDGLKQQLTQGLAERDTVLGRYDRLRKGLQNLVSHDDTPLSPAQTTEPTSAPAGPTMSNPS
jgi:hypothetical protein